MLFVTRKTKIMSKEQTPTPHNSAKYGEIAESVVMAGDPLRAKFMAENFLQDPVLYNEVRGMLGYTGLYKGKRVSVQGHGMGIPSIGIYTYELFNFYDVERIIRVGTCGALHPDVKIGNIVIAQGACTDSNYGFQYGIPCQYAPLADFGLLRSAADEAERLGLPYQVGNVLSTDVFYDESKSQLKLARFGIIGVEMESSALYLNAVASGKKALTILTVTDNIVTGESLSSDLRQDGLRNMIEVALSIA